MNAFRLEFEDMSGHPPPPHLSFEEYQRWIFEEIWPMMVASGRITEESLIADFKNNEGRMGEFKM
jgi:hypothetical protein